MKYIFLILLFHIPSSFSEEKVPLNCSDISSDYKFSVVQVSSNQNFYYCLGYLHAKDRGWQMDFFLRSAYGQVAETYGINYVKADVTMRALDIKSISKALWTNIADNHKIKWINYTNGINDAYEAVHLTKEFKAKGIMPFHWTPIDSISILLLFSVEHSLTSFYLKSQISNNQSILLHYPNLYALAPAHTTFLASQTKNHKTSTLLATNHNSALKTPTLWYLSKFKNNSNESLFGASIPGIPLLYQGINHLYAWSINHSFSDLLSFHPITNTSKDKIKESYSISWFKFYYFNLPYIYKKPYFSSSDGLLIKTKVNNQDSYYTFNWSENSNLFTSFNKLLNFQYPSTISTDFLKSINAKHFHVAVSFRDGLIFSNSEAVNYKGSFNAKVIKNSEVSEFEKIYLSKFKLMRINELFNSLSQMNKDSARKILCDNKIEEARELTPILIKLIKNFPQNEVTSKIIQSFLEWDQYASLDCEICTFYDLWLKSISLKFSIHRNKIKNFIEFSSQSDREQLHLLLHIAFRDATFKNKSQNDNWLTLQMTSRPRFNHLAINQDYQRSQTWNLAPLVPSPGGESSINTLSSNWSESLGSYTPTYGSSLKLIFEFEQSKPRAWISLSGKNKFYDRPADDSKTNWKDWSECNFYEVDL